MLSRSLGKFCSWSSTALRVRHLNSSDICKATHRNLNIPSERMINAALTRAMVCASHLLIIMANIASM
ncbi:hypothetical protein FIBSPDRAFT_869610, partial [Athelia psychrophila]